MAQHIAKDSFYKERLYQISMTSWGEDDGKTADKKKLKELSKNVMTKEVIQQSLGNFGKTAEGPHFSYLSFNSFNRQLYSIAGIEEFRHLQYIDVSNNNLVTLKPISTLKFVTFLNASNNQLTKLLDLKDIPFTLEDINFSFNKIETIPDISQHRFLKKVNLSNNQISKIEGVQNNFNLNVLLLANNKIENIENLDNMNLIELDLRGNDIQIINGLNNLPQLRILNLSCNRIKKLQGLLQLASLRELKLSNNKIDHVRELRYIEELPYLQILDLCFNKIQTRRYYRHQILYRLPGLRNLDGVQTTPEELLKSENLYGLDLEDRRRIFKDVLQDEEFIDRRINISELIEPETESDNEQQIEFIDKYNKQGDLVKSTSQVLKSNVSSKKDLQQSDHKLSEGNNNQLTQKSSVSNLGDTQKKLQKMREGSFDLVNKSNKQFERITSNPVLDKQQYQNDINY